MKKPRLEPPDWRTLPKDIWMLIGAFGSPLDVTRLRATSVFFRSVIADTAQNFRHTHVDTALFMAAEGGHHDIVELMIEKGATSFNDALCSAAYRGHRDIIKLMIEKGATSFNDAIYAAGQSGHRNIVELLKQKAAW